MAATARHFVNALVQWAILNFTTSPETPLIQSPETPLLAIEDLPPELLTCILEWLEEANAAQPGAHRKDLCSLCRTTRTLCRRHRSTLPRVCWQRSCTPRFSSHCHSAACISEVPQNHVHLPMGRRASRSETQLLGVCGSFPGPLPSGDV